MLLTSRTPHCVPLCCAAAPRAPPRRRERPCPRRPRSASATASSRTWATPGTTSRRTTSPSPTRQQQQAARRRHHDRRPDDRLAGAGQSRLLARNGATPSRSTASPREFASAGEDLVVTPARAAAGRRPDADHRAAHQRPRVRQGPATAAGCGPRTAWPWPTRPTPRTASSPCNDHPSDKALFTFRVTAPDGLTAVANGLPAGRDPARPRPPPGRTGPSTPWPPSWPRSPSAAPPCCTGAGPHGLPVRDVVPTSDRERLEPWLKKTPGQIAWMEEKVGRYPFETYGVLVARRRHRLRAGDPDPLALREATCSPGPSYPEWYVESIMVHELAHQWFGDSVSPRTWSDLWLNEGHATWYEALYAEEKADRPMEARMRAAYRALRHLARRGRPARRAQGGRTRARRSASSGRTSTTAARWSCTRCAQEIGSRGLRATGADLGERTHRDGVADTADFAHLASRHRGPGPDGLLRGLAVRGEDPADAGAPGLAQPTKPRSRPRAARGNPRSTGAETGRAVRPSSGRRDVGPAARHSRARPGISRGRVTLS